MDPSAELCLVYDSLKGEAPIAITDNSEWYSSKNQEKLTPQYNDISIRDAPPAIYCDTNRYGILQKVKDSFEAEGFIQARDATNPFEQIGRSIFMNRAAIKLANIDTVHHVTNETFTFDTKRSNTEFSFCDIAAGPGGFTQYIQYRFPNAQGYGMTLKHEKLDWSTRFLNMKQFTSFYGPDGTGDLYTNWNHFIQYVQTQQPNGVDLTTADGGFDLEDNMDKTLLHRQEFLSSRLLITQAVVGISITKFGGNFVLKVFDTVTNLSAQVLFILSQCFERISIFKPVSSRPANSERYFIGIDRRDGIQPYIELLSEAALAYQDEIYLESLFTNTLPQNFTNWLIKVNSLSIDRQLQAAQNILLYLRGTMPHIPNYVTSKFLIIWNLPDTPSHPVRNTIKII